MLQPHSGRPYRCLRFQRSRPSHSYRKLQNLEELRDHPEKLVILSWDKDIDGEFDVDLMVYLENRRGIVAEMASVITQAEANIEQINVEDRDAQLSVIHLTLSVQGRKHLARIIRRIRTIRSVNKIVRSRNQ